MNIFLFELILKICSVIKSKIKRMTTHCLIVQKDTFENGKIKGILTLTDMAPEELMSKLQENHCIEYQLLAHVRDNRDLHFRLNNLTNEYKTVHGKHWYNFECEVLGKIISLFLEYNMAVINFPLISNIMHFSFTLYPIVIKEIHIKEIDNKVSDNKASDRISDGSDDVKQYEKSDPSRIQKIEKNEKEELVSLLANIQETVSELPRRRKEKTEKKK